MEAVAQEAERMSNRQGKEEPFANAVERIVVRYQVDPTAKTGVHRPEHSWAGKHSRKNLVVVVKKGFVGMQSLVVLAAQAM